MFILITENCQRISKDLNTYESPANTRLVKAYAFSCEEGALISH